SFSILRPPPTPTLFPYTTLFRSFRFDDTIFKDLSYSYDTLINRFREQAYLTQGLRITLLDERTEQECTFYFEGGIVSFVRHLNKDRKSTRLNSSHRTISYAVFCL